MSAAGGPVADRTVTTREALLRDADAVQSRLRGRPGGGFDAFVSSDPASIERALDALGPANGRCFLEWGSGLGVAACLAALRGFRAHGIEIREDLVAEAEGLAARHGLPVTFARGTFIPSDHEASAEVADGEGRHDMPGEDGWDLLGLDGDDVDVVFAFPWPGEEDYFLDLFRATGRRGALLLLNLGSDDIAVYRHGGEGAMPRIVDA